MSLDEILEHIHVLVEKDTDYPTSSEEDYAARTKLVNNAIDIWASEEAVYWNELFTSLSDAADGDTTAVADTEAYDCPSDFEFVTGQLRLQDSDGSATYFDKIPPEDSINLDNDTGTYCFWVTGNDSAGYQVHIHPTPTDNDYDGYTIEYDYYKSPTTLSSATDETEMPDPFFAVYWVGAELLSDELPSTANTYRQIAMNKLRAMKVKNDTPAPWEPMVIQDSYSGFGV